MNAITCDMKFIRALREKQGMSRADLSIASKIPEGTIRKIESGTTRVDLEILTALRQALGLTWDAIGKFIDKELASAESNVQK